MICHSGIGNSFVIGFSHSSFQKWICDRTLKNSHRRFAEVEAALSDPRVFDNPQRAQELSREYAQLKRALVADGGSYLKTLAQLDENRALLKSEPADSGLAQLTRISRFAFQQGAVLVQLGEGFQIAAAIRNQLLEPGVFPG